jgi:hypothetical protein
MFKASLLVAVIATAGIAHAGGQPGSIGVGAEYQLSGVGGLSLQYDAGTFHAGAAIGLDDPKGGAADFQIAGDFWFHVHHTAFTDFSVGGSLGFDSKSVTVANMTNRNTDIFLEPGFQIRAFLSSNVALSATGGISIGLADANGAVAIAGQNFGAAGSIGIHYYFY